MREMGVREIRAFLQRLREAGHLMVGLPDYDRYVEHRRRRHPGEPVMSRAEFVADRSARRYGGSGAGRCC